MKCNIWKCKKEAVMTFSNNSEPFREYPYCEEHRHHYDELAREGRGKVREL